MYKFKLVEKNSVDDINDWRSDSGSIKYIELYTLRPSKRLEFDFPN
jgi:hypothetical protein